MKSNKLILQFAIILTILLTSNCGGLDNVGIKTVLTTQTPDKFYQTGLLPLNVQNITPTMAMTSTTATKTSTPAPVSSDTMSSVPTLTVEDARSRMNDLLAGNGECILPCFWGIFPGITTSKEAMTILSPLSSLSALHVFKPEAGLIILNDGLLDDQIIHIYISYLASYDMINLISFDSKAIKRMVGENGSESVFDSETYGTKLSFYSLQQLLATQGRPGSVLLNTWGEFPPPPYGQGHFQLILIYPEKGIIVQYTTEMKVIGKNVEGCLANAHVEMTLVPKGNVDDFYKQLTLTDWERRIKSYKPIEEVTAMSVDDFYQAFQKPTDECLVTPANLWPLPEK